MVLNFIVRRKMLGAADKNHHSYGGMGAPVSFCTYIWEVEEECHLHMESFDEYFGGKVESPWSWSPLSPLTFREIIRVLNNFWGVVLRNWLCTKNKTQHQHSAPGQAWCVRIRSNGLRMIDGVARAVHGRAVRQVAHLWPNKKMVVRRWLVVGWVDFDSVVYKVMNVFSSRFVKENPSDSHVESRFPLLFTRCFSP